MALHRTQAAFLEAIRGGDARAATQRPELAFRAPPVGSVESRFHIYSSGYLARLVEALEDDFPALRRILGAGPFGSLTERYIAANPPRSYDLGRAGARLAGFLETDPLRHDLPFLADLARLEWALAEAFVAPDEAPVTWEELQRLGAEELIERPLGLLWGTVLLRSRWPLIELWRLKDVADEDVDLAVEGQPSRVLVARRGLDVRPHEVDERSARVAELAQRGGVLADAMGSAAGPDEIDQIVSAFRSLVVLGVVSNRTASGGLTP